MSLESNLEKEADKKGLTGEAKQQYVGGTIHNIKKRAYGHKRKAIAEWEKEHGIEYNSWLHGEIKTDQDRKREERQKKQAEKQRIEQEKQKKHQEYLEKRDMLKEKIAGYERLLPRMKQSVAEANAKNEQYLQEYIQQKNTRAIKKVKRTVRENNEAPVRLERVIGELKQQLRDLRED